MTKTFFRYIFTFTIISFFLSACGNREKSLEGTWIIDQAYYNDSPVFWDLYGNEVGLKKDSTCSLPALQSRPIRVEGDEKGVWKTFEKNGVTYLQINTDNRIFNRTFEVQNMREVLDSAISESVIKMTLSADSLKLDCSKLF